MQVRESRTERRRGKETSRRAFFLIFVTQPAGQHDSASSRRQAALSERQPSTRPHNGMWPFSSSSTPEPAASAPAPAVPAAAPTLAPAPTAPAAAARGPASAPAVNPYSLEAYQPLTAVDRSSPTAPPAFSPTVPVEPAPAAAAGEPGNRPKINVQPPLPAGSRRPVAVTPELNSATLSSSSTAAPEDPAVTTRQMTETELAKASEEASRSSARNRLTPGGSRAAALSPGAQFIGRQANVNCSDLRAAFDACDRSTMFGGACEGLKRTWQGCVDEQKVRKRGPLAPLPNRVSDPCPRLQDLLAKSGFGKEGNTLQRDLYLAALADQTGLKRRAALAADRGEDPSTEPSSSSASPAGSSASSSAAAAADTSSKKPKQEPSTFSPLLGRDLPARNPQTGELEWAGERRARQASELATRRAAAEKVLEERVQGKRGLGEAVVAWFEMGRVGWAEGTWEGGRGWGAGPTSSTTESETPKSTTA